MEVLQIEMTQETWDDWGTLIKGQECSECGSDLVIRTIPERASMELGCAADHSHSGFRQRTSITEEYRRGAEVYPTIRDNIEAKMMLKTEFNRAMNLLAMRWPDAIKDKAGAALFINDCMRLGLDPLIQPAEAVPIPFRSKDKSGREKITVAMIVTEDGALSMVARGCPDEYDGAPATMTLMDYLMREHPQRDYENLLPIAQRTARELCDDPEAYVWVALGKRRSATEVNPVYGYYTQAEREKAEKNRLPAAKQPGNQARVRAIKRWVRENFPEARQKMLEYTTELNRRSEGVQAAQEFIDAEYTTITGPPGQKAATDTKEKKATVKQGEKVGESAQRKPEELKSTATPSGADETTSSPKDRTGNGKKIREASATTRDPTSIETFGDLYTACFQDWPNAFKERKDIWAELGYSSQMEIADTPAECYIRIRAARE